MTALLAIIAAVCCLLMTVAFGVVWSECKRLSVAQDTQHLTLMDHGERLASVERQAERDAGRHSRPVNMSRDIQEIAS